MASTFHLFPRLPAELRLQIWEAACLPATQHRRGLHYLTLDDRDCFIPFGWNTEARSEQKHPMGLGNRSAYLWHAGLWMACQESRGVVMKHSRIEEWREIAARARREGKELEKYGFDWAAEGEAAHPGILDSSMMATIKGNEEWHYLTYPTRDMFCVTADDWASLPPSDSTVLFFSVAPIIGRGLGSFELLVAEQFALEFDPSWNIDFPTDADDLKEEQSARGYLARVVARGAEPPLMKDRIWLVDKNTPWQAPDDEQFTPAFQDCDGEYVEIDWTNIAIDPNGPAGESSFEWEDTYGFDACGADASPIIYFMFQLDRLCRCWYQYLSPEGSPISNELLGLRQEYPLLDNVRLLVRRDNRVAKDDKKWTTPTTCQVQTARLAYWQVPLGL